MRWYGKEITVARGENFSLTCKITNEDGTPYMISDALTNPTFLLTIANTLYKTDNKRYVLKCWTPLVTNSQGTFVNGYVFEELTPRIVEDLDIVNNDKIDTGKRYLYKLTKRYEASGNIYEPDYYIWSTDDSKFIKYETIFSQQFPSYITKDWYSKNFYYELRLVAGTFTNAFKQALDNNSWENFSDNPFDLITHEFVVIPKNQINVLSRLGGYGNE